MSDIRRIHAEAPASGQVVRVRDAQSGEALYELEHPDRVWSVAISADQRLLATGCRDTIARLWDAQTGRHLRILMKTGDGTPAHYGYVWSVAFSPDGAVVATGGYDGKVRLWDVEAARQIACFDGGPLAQQSPPGLTVRFSSDGSQVFAKPAGAEPERGWPVPAAGPSI